MSDLRRKPHVSQEKNFDTSTSKTRSAEYETIEWQHSFLPRSPLRFSTTSSTAR